MTLFEDDSDYEAFERVIEETVERAEIRLLSYCLMSDWNTRVNRAMNKRELDAMQRSVTRGQPYGSDRWVRYAAKRLGLEPSLRPRKSPRPS